MDYLHNTIMGFCVVCVSSNESPHFTIFKWHVQAELVHCRFAMAGVAGIGFTDVSCLAELCLCNSFVFAEF
jgi:hypothetical protein